MGVSYFMILQVVGSSEFGLALITLVGFLSGVRPFVLGETARVGASIGALVTLIQFNSGVSLLMQFHAAQVPARVSAQFAQKRFRFQSVLLFVHDHLVVVLVVLPALLFLSDAILVPVLFLDRGRDQFSIVLSDFYLEHVANVHLAIVVRIVLFG